MNDFILDNFGKLIIGSILLIIFIIGFMAWYEATHCIKGHTESKQSYPIYMNSGSVMIPVGQSSDIKFVCDKWK